MTRTVLHSWTIDGENAKAFVKEINKKLKLDPLLELPESGEISLFCIPGTGQHTEIFYIDENAYKIEQVKN